jgi:glycosyltransferase involved in cell wall biosynthesis
MLERLTIGLVGPVPPPAGGMAMQTAQLRELLTHEGADVLLVPVNPPYRPRWVEGVQGVRALFRLLPYLGALWRASARTDILHVMANSGWSWHLFAAPAIWIARLRGTPVVVNYRGGDAEAFLASSAALVRASARRAAVVAVPSRFLQRIFEAHGIPTEIVANIVDLQRFRAAPERQGCTPHVVVTRNLEAIYDIGTALRAFAKVLTVIPDATMTVAGSGPEHANLVALAAELGIGERVAFTGRLDRDQVAELYCSASVAANPSRIDNMPNSVLEAMACGLPVVSTDAGGVPFILRDGETGLLVKPGDYVAMAAAITAVLSDHTLSERLRRNALIEVQQYAWPRVRERWLAVYREALSTSHLQAHRAS